MSSAPTKYTRQADFSDFSTTHPGEQQPGVDLDNEYDRIKEVTDKTIDRLGEIQRTDGKLMNQGVHKDSLSAEVRAMIATGVGLPRGSWAALTDYAAKDLASFANITYIAVSAHTSGPDFSADLAAGKWMILSVGADLSDVPYFEYFAGTGAAQNIVLGQNFGDNPLAIEVYAKEDGSHFERVDPANYTLAAGTLTGTFPNGARTVLVFSPSTTVAAQLSAAVISANASAVSAAAALVSQNAATASQAASAASATQAAASATIAGATVSQWAVATGTANAQVGAFPTTVTSLTDGLILGFRAVATNTTTTPTFKADGTTARTITRDGGQALLAGDIRINGEYFVRYNLANTRWELFNPSANGASYVNTAGFAPTGTTSAAAVMMGIGSSVQITPKKSGVVQVLMSGTVTTGGTAVNIANNIGYGLVSSGVPANGDPATGIDIQVRDVIVTATTPGRAMVTFNATVGIGTPLTLGVPYWFDWKLQSNGINASSVIITSATLREI